MIVNAIAPRDGDGLATFAIDGSRDLFQAPREFCEAAQRVVFHAAQSAAVVIQVHSNSIVAGDR